MKLFVLLLLVAGSIATQDDSKPIDSPDDSADCIDENCGNLRITVTDTWAGECFTSPGCRDVFCVKGEIIDRSTCTPYGRLEDCKCIIPTTTIAPTTVQPTRGPLAGCEWCLNTKLSVGKRDAGHCFPHQSNDVCSCLCGDIFCRVGQIIDKSTCVSGGSLSACKCIDAPVSRTTTMPIATDS